MAQTTLEKYVEQTAASVAPLKQASIEILAEAKQITVIDNASLSAAIAMKKKISGQAKSVETARKQFTQPLDNVKSQLMDLERDVMVELDEAKGYIGKQILDFEAEQLRLKEEEEARVAEVVKTLRVAFSNDASIDELKQLGGRIKNKFADLSVDDQALPEVKSQFLSTVNSLTGRIEVIQEQQRQAAEDERLAKIRAEQSAERADLEKKKAEQDAEERRIARERRELDERKKQQAIEDERRAKQMQAEKAAKAAPKTNTVTNYSFEIVDASKVPAAYLSPDLTKIREAVKQAKGNIEIAGVKITANRVAR